MSDDIHLAVKQATDAHRAIHGCGTYPFEDGTRLSMIAAMAQPARILELGTALGYTALSLVRHLHNVHLDTVERDPEHVVLARGHIEAAGRSADITVHEGGFGDVLPKLAPGYGLAFFDGYAPGMEHLAAFERLLVSGGTLITTNFHVGGPETANYAAALADPARWISMEMPGVGGTMVSVRK